MPRQTTTVNFYKNINLPRDYSQVCDSISLASLSSYLVWTSSDLSVIRHNSRTGSFKIQKNINDLSYINYLAIYNNAGDRSPLFAFVTDINYVTDSVSEVFFEVDLFSSYCQSLDYQDCYITRMTTSDDTMYKYLEDEPVNGGDYVTNPNQIMREFITNWYYGYTAVSNSSGSPVDGKITDNIFSVARFYGERAYGPIVEDLQLYNSNGYIDNVCDVFQYPAECGEEGNKSISTKAIAFPSTIDGYTPKNNKLFNYPFVRSVILSSGGDSLEIKPEKCQNDEIKYRLEKAVFPINQFVLTLDGYDRLSADDQKASRIIMTGFPEVVWSSDNYRAWLARNKPTKDLAYEQIIANVVAGVGSLRIASAAKTLTPAGAALTGWSLGVNAIMGAESQRAQDESAQIQSNTIHRGGNLGIDVTNNKFGFIVLIQSIDARRASLIDNYFNAFGYAINKVTYFSPHRARFDYVETRGNLFRRESEGLGIPNAAVETMNAAANRGLRIWHSLSELNRGDLVSVNSIV